MRRRTEGTFQSMLLIVSYCIKPFMKLTGWGISGHAGEDFPISVIECVLL